MKIKKLFATVSAAAMMTAFSAQAADIVIGTPNWVSVQGTAEIIKVVLEDNLGLEVEIQNGTNPIVFEAMDKGSMHVHPEVWLPNQQNLYNTYVVEKETVVMNPNAVISFQGICVPTPIAEEFGVKKISDLTDPKIAKIFDRDGDGKGDLWIGATGWASTNVEKIRAKSYGYDQTLDLKEMDETLAMSELDAATTQGRAIVTSCYNPHYMFVKYDLTVLEEPAHDPDKWTVLQPTDDPDWLAKSSAGVAWNDSKVYISFAKSLLTDQPDAASILSKIDLDVLQVSDMVYQITENNMDFDDYARKFVDENKDQVDSWLR